jgi:aquaglyceroporin related protein
MQVTLCMAIFRGFPWRKVPGYVLGQLIGAWAGAIIVFGNYFHAIDIVEGGKGKRSSTTAGLFGTFAVRITRSLHNLSHMFCSLTTCPRQTASSTR